MISGLFGLLSVIMVSWFSGLLITAYLKNQHYYSVISNLFLLRSQKLYTLIGIKAFKWLVTRTIYRHLNKNIKLSSRPDQSELISVRSAMADSEVLHGVAFILVVLVGVPVLIVQDDYELVLYLTALNIVFNLYPVLLQQYNKEKLDKLICRVTHKPTTV